jgi:hypothetical protein
LARAYHAAGRRSEAKAAQAKAKQIAAYMAQADQMEGSVRKSDDPELLRRFATLLHNAGQADRARAYLQFAETLERSGRNGSTPSSPPSTPPAAGFPVPR